MSAVFDLHVYAGPSLFERGVSRTGLDAMTQQHEGFRALLIPAKPPDYLLLPACARVAAWAAELNWPWALRIDPWREAEALDAILESDAAALFLHPKEEQFSPTSPRVHRLVEAAANRGMLIVIAAGYLPEAHPAQLRPLIEAFPKARFLLTHGGQINICGAHIEEAWGIFESQPQTHFETSGIYRQDYIERAVRELGPQRVHFGSGAPTFHQAFELARIDLLEVDAAAREQIRGAGALELLRLEPT